MRWGIYRLKENFKMSASCNVWILVNIFKEKQKFYTKCHVWMPFLLSSGFSVPCPLSVLPVHLKPHPWGWSPPEHSCTESPSWVCWESVCEKLTDFLSEWSNVLRRAQISPTAFLSSFQTLFAPFFLTLSTWFLCFGIQSSFVLVLQVYLSLPVCFISLHIHGGLVLGPLQMGIWFGQEVSDRNLVFPAMVYTYIWLQGDEFFPHVCYSCGEYKVEILHLGIFLN